MYLDKRVSENKSFKTYIINLVRGCSMFSIRFRRVRCRQHDFCFSHWNRFSLTSYIFWGNVLIDLSVTLTQAHDCGTDKQNLSCLYGKVGTYAITTKLDGYTHLVIFITWLNFGEISLDYFVVIFYSKISDVFFKLKHSIGHILEMVGPSNVKRIYRLSMGCHTVSSAPVWARIPGP